MHASSCWVVGVGSMRRKCIMMATDAEGEPARKHNNTWIKHEWTNLGPKAEVWSIFSSKKSFRVIGLGWGYIWGGGKIGRCCSIYIMKEQKHNQTTKTATHRQIHSYLDTCTQWHRVQLSLLDATKLILKFELFALQPRRWRIKHILTVQLKLQICLEAFLYYPAIFKYLTTKNDSLLWHEDLL